MTTLTEITIKQRAEEYAEEAYNEITSNPFAYGVNDPWDSVNEWIDFEMDGGAGDEFKTQEERQAIRDALFDAADLKHLNYPFLDGLVAKILGAKDLYDQLESLRRFERVLCGEGSSVYRDEDVEGELRSRGVDICELPTFGGEAPKSTTEVWSWDEDSLLMGTGPFKDWEIVDRPQDNGEDA